MNRSTMPMANRVINIAIGGAVILSIILDKNPERVFLGFWRPTDTKHIIYDISVFCSYLLCCWMVYRGFAPKRQKTETESHP
jgi:hypothetical protein